MKLSALNSAIRNLDGPPQMALRLAGPDGSEVILEHLAITKQSLLAALKARFGEARGTETGLTLVGHRLCHEGMAHRVTPEPDPEPAAAPPATDLEDMFG